MKRPFGFKLLLFFLFQVSLKSEGQPQSFYPVHGSEFKALARVVVEDRKGQVVDQCSGVLVASTVVLTARHCIENRQINTVILGTHNSFEVHTVSRISTEDQPRSLLNFFDQAHEFSQDFINQPQIAAGKDLLVLHLSQASKFKPIDLLPQPLYKALNGLRISLIGFPHDSDHFEAFPKGFSVPFPYTSPGAVPQPVTTLGVCYFDDSEDNSRSLRSDCISKPGQSGGPLLTKVGEKFYVVAISSESEVRRVQNFLGRDLGTSTSVNLGHPKIRSFLESKLK